MANYLLNFLESKREADRKKAENKEFIDNMYDDSRIIPGSTLTSTTATTQRLYINKDITFMQNKEEPNVVDGITHDYLTNDYNKLPSSVALYKALLQLRDELEAIDPDNNFLQDNTVITLPLAPFYKNEIWEMTRDWQFYSEKAIYISKGDNNNYLIIKNDVITKTGYYLIDIDVAEIASGVLDIKDFKNDIIGTVTKKGETVFEVFVSNENIAQFKITARETYFNDKVIINRVGLHYITDRFKDYIDYRFKMFSLPDQDTNIGITEDLVIKIVKDYLKIESDLLNKKIDDHIKDKNNPHGITCEQIDAAKADHTHKELDIIPEVKTHLKDYNNPHKVTPQKIGAAKEDHNHDKVYSLISHEHADYLKYEQARDFIEDEVKGYIDYLSNEGESGIAKDILPAPYLFSNPKYLGNLPFALENANITRPYMPIITPYLEHRTSNGYSYMEGISSSNIRPNNDNPIQYAFMHQLNMEEFNINVAAFTSFRYPTIDPVIVSYEFNVPREIKGYTMYKDATNKINGFPIEWDVLINDNSYTSVYYPMWAETDEGGGNEYFPLRKGRILTRKFSLVIKQIRADIVEHLNAYQWGFRLEFDFSDVHVGNIAIPFPITSIFNSKTKYEIPRLETSVDIREDNSPMYLFLKVDRTRNEDNEVEYTPSLVTSGIRPEFSTSRLGVPLFLDKFKEKENSVYGNLSVSDEDIDHPVQFLYTSSNSLYFSTNENINFAVIDHEFINPLDVIGHKFYFSVEYLENIPNSWEIVYTLEDGSEESFSVDNYYPSNNPFIDFNIIDVKYDNILKNVIKYKLSLSSRGSSSKIIIHRFMPMITGWWCNPYASIVTDYSLAPVGKISYVRSAIDNNHTYKVQSIPYSNIIRIPLNNFDYIYKSREFKIDNPFLTKDISVRAVQGTIIVSKITDEEITIINTSKGRHVIEVSRLW